MMGFFKKGQVSVVVASIMALGTVGASAIAGWATSSATYHKEVSELNTKIQVVEEREDNHFKELLRVVNEINKKLE